MARDNDGALGALRRPLGKVVDPRIAREGERLVAGIGGGFNAGCGVDGSAQLTAEAGRGARRGEGHRVEVARDLLTARVEDDLLLGAGDPVGEGNESGCGRAAELGGHEERLAFALCEDVEVSLHVGVVAGLPEEAPQLGALLAAERGERGVYVGGVVPRKKVELAERDGNQAHEERRAEAAVEDIVPH